MRAFLPALVWALLAAGGMSGPSAGDARAAFDARRAGPPARPPGVRAHGISNPGSDRLGALTPLNPHIALWRAIRANGHACARVTASAYQQDYHELAMWVALCEGGRRWAVFIAPNDDVQVRDCRAHAQLDLPACRPMPRSRPIRARRRAIW
jgi:hypothetical protein